MNFSQYSIEFAPLIPLWILGGFLILGASLLIVFAMLQAKGILLRIVTFALLAILLANPSLQEEKGSRDPTVALIMMDESGSQSIAPRRAQSEAALQSLLTRLEAFPLVEARVVRWGNTASSESEGSNLKQPLNQALAEIPASRLGGVFVITDGQIVDEGIPGGDTFFEDVPLHLLRSGAETEFDRKLVIEAAPGFAVIDQPVTMSLRIIDELQEAQKGIQKPVRLRITQDGSTVLDQMVTTNTPITVPFTLSQRGESLFDIEVESIPGELTHLNNRQLLSIKGVRERLRVLLVTGLPHGGTRMWRNILKSDPSVDLIHFTILRTPDKQDYTPVEELSLIPFPTRELFETKLNDFDLVVFDRYERRGILPTSYLQNVADYIEAGGAFLETFGPASAGPLSLAFTPLGEILPVAPTGDIFEAPFTPTVSDIGLRHPVTASLPEHTTGGPGYQPWGRWFRVIPTEVRAGHTLLAADEHTPLLVLSRQGKGRIATLTSDQLWLWARGVEGGGPYVELVRRIIHWLMKEPDLEEETLRADVVDNTLRITRRTLEEQTAPVTIHPPEGEAFTAPLDFIAPGVATTSLPVDAPGLYQIEDGDLTAFAAFGVIGSREFQDVLASDDKLAPLVSASGGGLVHLYDQTDPSLRLIGPNDKSAGPGWFGLVDRKAERITDVERVPLLPAALALLLVLLALFGGWLRESK